MSREKRKAKKEAEKRLSTRQFIGATLTVMENGEHWFHTKEQMDFLSDWIKQCT